MNTRYEPVFSGVRVTDGYAANAFRRETDYLLSLEAGRLLAGFYENAGIRTPYVRYGGWESSLIGGHTLGHVLSALAHACVSADGELRTRLLRKIRSLLEGLAACQAAVGSGLVWGATPTAQGGIEAQFDNVECGKGDILREAWVPWYTLHKLLSGLLDVCTLPEGADAQPLRAEAREIAVKLGEWASRRALGWSDATRKVVLSVEYGGMNDCLYALYALTGEPLFADAAHVFDEEELFSGILARRKDFLDGKHANTTIPKFLGALNRYLVLHGTRREGERVDASRYLEAAKVFFETVVHKHTYVTGGNSEWEHFGKDGVLDAERTNCNCETCNVYNMLKLARGLFAVTGEKEYLDYYDNAFVNDILASQNPETGMTTYFQPMAGGFFKVFSRPYDKFWCCTGSGMESFSNLGDAIYYAREGEVVVARYLSSRLVRGGTEISLEAEGFGEKFVLKADRAAGKLLLKFRIPDWCSGEPVLLRNGAPSGVVRDGFWETEARAGDVFEGKFPATVALVGLPDRSDVFAVKYGGMVLSSDLGRDAMEETETGVEVSIPRRRVLATETLYFADVGDVLRRPAAYFQKQGDNFVLRGADLSLTFGPHYKRYRERYAIYYRFREGAREAEEGAREAIDSVEPGYGQYERDDLHAMREENSACGEAGTVCRFALPGGYFAYDVAVDPQKRNTLAFFLLHEENGRYLKVSAEGEVLLDGRLLDTMGEEKYQKELVIPPKALKRARKKQAGGKMYDVIAVRFEGDGKERSAKVCDKIRIFCE